MKIAVLNWFGWSIFWITPLVWRFVKTRASGQAFFRGQGSIRLCLGTVLMVCASSALEASIRVTNALPPDIVTVGQRIAAMFARLFGGAGGILILLVLATVALCWLRGSSLLALAGRLVRFILRRRGKGDNETGARPGRRTATQNSSRQSVSGQGRPAESAHQKNSRKEAWHPSLTRAVADVHAKDKRVAHALPEKQSAARPMGAWAEVEQIIPTLAMRSRVAPPEPVGHGGWTSGGPQVVEEVHRMQTSSVRIIRKNPNGQTSIHVRHVTDASVTLDGGLTPGAAVPKPSPGAEAVVYQHVSGAGEQTVYLQAPVIPPLTLLDIHGTPISTGSQDSIVSGQFETIEYVASAPGAIAYSPSLPEAADVIEETDTVPQAVELQTQPSSFNVRQARSGPDADDFEFHAPRGLDIDLPGLDLLDAADTNLITIPPERLAETAQLIEQRLREFKVPVTVIGADAGPVITRFEVEPALGVRGSQIVGLMKDLSRALGMTSIRVVETIPGKTCMGLELPNVQRQMIRLSEILESKAYRQSASHLTMALGKDITGNPVVADLARAPHMLVAGTTGSGKSVAINAMILSLLYKATPADVRLIMIDPKMLELSVYEGIPHLLAPVVTDMKLAANALSWCVTEMDKRYRLMSALGVRNLAGFNQKIRDGERKEKKVTNPFSLTPDAPEPLSTLPMIVVIIDELADLMMVAGKKIEELIARLAQKARAAGIHLILATQRPSVDVITGLIKANIPTRVAFQVSSKIDSRTILDQMGAEALLGHGDMLFLPPGSGYPQRVHGAFVSDEEVHRVVEFLKQFGEPEYEDAILNGAPVEGPEKDLLGDVIDPETDPLYDEAVAFVVRTRRASISSVQRQLRVGYNRAARLVEQMEAAGILSSMATNGSREVLVPKMGD